jgi:cobalt/nickel transport system permease protein
LSEIKNKIPSFLLLNVNERNDPADRRRVKISFLDKTVLSSARAVKSIYLQAENASRNNIIQNINPYVKFISLIYMVVVISIVHNPGSQIFITAFIFLLYCIASLKVFQVFRKIFIIAFVFGFLTILPASLNVITPGNIIFNLITFDKPSHFWIYNIPQHIGITENGIQVVALFFLRVLNSVSIALLIVYTTPFPSLIKSSKILGVPDTFLMILTLAYKYIFILSRTIEETYLALKSRLAGNIRNRNIREVIGGRILFIFKRSIIIYENTYNAMVSRGYTGKIKLQAKYPFTTTDFIAIVVVASSGIAFILL